MCVCVNGRKLVGVGDKEGMFRTKDVDARAHLVRQADSELMLPKKLV